jgi:hypothetical protein
VIGELYFRRLRTPLLLSSKIKVIIIVGTELIFLDATCTIIAFKHKVLVYPPALSHPL